MQVKAGAWSAGAVARRLGIPASTLRTWHHRYGVRPAQDRAGGHRLYSDAVAELERIQRSVADGMPMKAAVEAVRRDLAAGSEPTAPAAPAPVRSAAGVQAAAERLDHASLDLAFDSALVQEGALRTRERLCRPPLVRTGRRVVEAGDCTDVEWVLAGRRSSDRTRPARRVPRSRGRGLHAAGGGGSPPTAGVGARCRRVRTARIAPLRKAGRHAELVLAVGRRWANRRLPADVMRAEDLRATVELVLAHALDVGADFEPGR